MQLDIFDKVLSVSWLFEKVFWKLLPDLVYDQTVENYKHILKHIYGYDDIDKVFKKQLLRHETMNLWKVVFKYQDRELAQPVKSN